MHLSLRLDPGSEEPVFENEGKIVVAACLYFGPVITKEARTRKNVFVKCYFSFVCIAVKLGDK